MEIDLIDIVKSNTPTWQKPIMNLQDNTNRPKQTLIKKDFIYIYMSTD